MLNRHRLRQTTSLAGGALALVLIAGPAFAQNRYDEKVAAGLRKFS